MEVIAVKIDRIAEKFMHHKIFMNYTVISVKSCRIVENSQLRD